MKIKIAYTIDDSELPAEISKFLNRVNEELSHNIRDIKEISDNIKSNFDVDDTENYYHQINKIRKKMIETDTIMSDCQDIFIGFHSIVKQQEEVPAPAGGFFQTEKEPADSEESDE